MILAWHSLVLYQMDQLSIFVRQTTYIVRETDVIIDWQRMIVVVIVIVVQFLPKSMNVNGCSFVLFVVREETIDVLCTYAGLSLSFSTSL